MDAIDPPAAAGAGQPSASPRASTYPPLRQGVIAIAVLMLISFMSRVDQQIPSLLVGPIKDTFDLSDTQMSMVQGMSFALVYAFMGPICGVMIDRYNRRNLIIIGMVFWSAMTIWSGLANSYWELLASRAGVGIGDAVLAPAAYAMIADYFEPKQRGRALSVYMTSVAAGAGFSYIIGGAVIGAVAGAATIALPIVGDVEPWRVVFVAVGVPGLLAPLLSFVVREPVRREDGSMKAAKDDPVPYSEFLRFLGRNWRVLSLVTVSLVSGQFVINALLAWMPTFFERQFGIPVQEIGLQLGMLFCVTSIAGFMFGGALSDRAVSRNDLAARLRPQLTAFILVALSMMAWPFAQSVTMNFVVLGVAIFGGCMVISTLPTTLQEMAPTLMRGRTVTLAMLAGSIVGWGLGPAVPAFFTDFVFKDEGALRASLVCSALPIAIIAFTSSYLSTRPYAALRSRILAGTA